MLLLQKIVFGINKGLVSLVPALCPILLVRKSDSEELLECLGRWVVSKDDKLRPLIIFVVKNGAFNYCIILSTNTVGNFTRLNTGIFLERIGQNFLILLIAEIDGVLERVSIIISNKLRFCSSDSIMMLQNTHGI